MDLHIVILAAGKGTRMRSALPKVLHPVAHKPMVKHVIDCAHELGAKGIHLVYGHGGELMRERLAGEAVDWALQAEQLGTGHAVAQAMPSVPNDALVLVLYGDVPLIRAETLKALLAKREQGGLCLLTVTLPDPCGYGRILREGGLVVGIREQKDANAEELAVNEVNTGILAAEASDLKRWLGSLSNNNAQGEYYLTDIIAMAHGEGKAIATAHPVDAMEVEGANNRVQLAALERAYQQRQVEQLMLAGATLRDPARVDVRGEVSVGEDVMVDVNVIFEGKVSIGNQVTIESGCALKDCAIGDGTHIKAQTLIDGASVGANCTLGPFARLRPGAVMKDDSHVGNFVEMKKAVLGQGSKANHLSYLGDAEIGAGVNIGAGTITCNYDGANKFLTRIEDGAFIGSNSSLVAPVTIGRNATVGAGSTIAKDVAEAELAVARGKQRNIEGWQRPVKKK
ncbi:bifunctional UDP-N-acetylglucosamine diphosphorylase/glucosamine-1-phosphate N-acetyltransferase GlmU [Gallaecimonas kandeliae]|uniref:bifunctional UDP-N-acetylglucosamine diphosphorylase/glucosamine-1-phosphate N-acetyltransferase GlmU n=1 Tax=Gallaecimonas kandeliae TaxID=3029055 RepID=UPI00264995DF|nr:bifunctional UDP-N-acetylglucosamine diphosphorylase/glucosamine-1-phosphate N-acetyltransferase GlmU [Gallaecimonas kandeliae]WKE65640.1 bifunctional UDP-N-acetylglucosamine diphosphorylase/glucosamine-1-phosphate N-acetyltransferase GlmU [Gallaecimonas kandeliae]